MPRCYVTCCAEHDSANTRPHQLCWGDHEMVTAISCTKCSQVPGHIHAHYTCIVFTTCCLLQVYISHENYVICKNITCVTNNH